VLAFTVCIDFPFIITCNDGDKKGLLPRGRGGPGPGPAKGLVFGGFHVLLLKF